MTIYTMPAGRAMIPASQQLYLTPIGGMTRSPLTGDTRTVSLPVAYWTYELSYSDQAWDDRDRVQGLFELVTRSEHRIALHDLSRPVPRGTANVAGVVLAAAAPQFADVVQLAGLGAGRTLLPSDMLGIGGQLCRVALQATANGSGVATVTLASRLRVSAPVGSPVVLDRPTGLFVVPEPVAWPRGSVRRCPAVSVKLVEVFA